jgi:hypothetical protein
MRFIATIHINMSLSAQLQICVTHYLPRPGMCLVLWIHFTYMRISRAVIVTSQQLEMFEIIHKCMTDDMLLFSSTVAKSQSIFRSSSEQIAPLRL